MAQNSTYTRRIQLFINGKEISNDVKSIKAEMQRLINAQAKMTIGSKEYVQHGKQIQVLNGILQQHRAQLTATQSAWDKAASFVKKYVGMIAGGLSIAGLFAWTKQADEAFLKLDDKLSDVQKTTGLTRQEVEWLNEELKIVDTRTAQENLLDLARVAGKLGISAKDDVLGFVKAADQINVALTEDLGGNAEEAINKLGKLVDIFKVKDEFGIEQSLLKTGSAINSLGAAGTANEGYMVDFAQRVGGIAPMAGVSIQQVLGLGATLDELGQSAEVGGTTYSQVMNKMFTDTNTFAKMAGMGVKDFTELLNKDANEAFIKVLQGAKGSAGGFDTLAKNLSAMGLDGARSTAVLAVLAGNIDKLREKQELANVEFAKGTSLTEEFNTKNNNAAAEREKARKQLNNIAVEFGQKLSPYITDATNSLSGFLTLLIKLPAFIAENKTLFFALAGAVTAYNARLIQSSLLKLKDMAVSKALIATEKQGLVARNLQAIWMRTYIAMTGNATMAQKRFLVATKQANAAMLSNPVGIVIASLTALVLAIKAYDKYNSQAIERERLKKIASEGMATANNQLSETYKKLSTDINDINKMSVERQRQLRKEAEQAVESAIEQIKAQKALRDQVYETAKQLSVWEKIKVQISKQAAVGDTRYGSNTKIQDDIAKVEALSDAWKESNAKEAVKELDDQLAELGTNLEKLKEKKTELDDIFNAEKLGDEIGTQTLANLEEKMSKYQLALKGAVIGSEDFLRIQKKIADTQKLMAKFQPDAIGEEYGKDDKKEKKKLEKLAEEKKKAQENYAKKVLEIRRQLKLDTLSEEDQEFQKIKDKYADLLETAKEFGIDTKELEELKQRELTAVVVKYEQERTKLRKEAEERIAEITMSERDKAISDVTKKYQELIKLAEENGLATTELYRRLNEELAAIQGEKFSDEADIFGMTPEDWQILFENFDLVMKYAEQISSIWGNMNTIMANKEQSAYNKFEKNTKKKKELLADQLDKGIITQEQYNGQVAKLDADLDNKKAEMQRKQAKRDKKLKMFQAITSTAAAVIHMLADPGGYPGLALSILAGIAGATQIAAIASEPLPEFAEGGYNGFTQGDGVYTGSSGRPFRAGERNKREWIGSNSMVTNPYTGPIIAALESVQRGRVPASIFAQATNAPAFGAFAASMPQYAKGGYNGTATATQTVVQQSIDIAPLVQGINNMVDESRQLRQYLSDPKNRQAYITDKTLKTYNKEEAERNTLARMQ